MRVEKLRLYVYLALLLIVGFGLINLSVFVKLKRLYEEQEYELAKKHFLIHLYNPSYRGDEVFVIADKPSEGYRTYVFSNPTDPLRAVVVAVKEDRTLQEINRFMKGLLLLEFVLVFLLVLMFQLVMELYLRRLKEQEEWLRALMLSVTHRLGNFLATQKVSLALLKNKLPNDQSLKRMEKSLSKAQMDFNIFFNLIKEEKKPQKKYLAIDEQLMELLDYFQEELSGKKLTLRLKKAYVSMDEMDLRDILYNLLSNAVKHSASRVFIKVCSSKGLTMLVVKNDVGGNTQVGMGMGLRLLQEVLKRYGAKLRVRIKKDYVVFVVFRG